MDCFRGIAWLTLLVVLLLFLTLRFTPSRRRQATIEAFRKEFCAEQLGDRFRELERRVPG
jgi:hypothetical protein